jgi:hypothetical protein
MPPILLLPMCPHQYHLFLPPSRNRIRVGKWDSYHLPVLLIRDIFEGQHHFI